MNPDNIYLELCATYHSACVDWYLNNIQKSRTALHGHCNAGTTLTNEKGYYGSFDMWLNNKGIINLQYIPQQEEYGYIVTYNTQEEWILHTPYGTPIMFKRYTAMCNHMTYINMQ